MGSALKGAVSVRVHQRNRTRGTYRYVFVFTYLDK